MSELWVITYDISNDKARREVADCLKNYGQRVQYSIFECHISRTELTRLRSEIVSRIEKDDSVRYYFVCKWCEQKIGRQGRGKLTADPDFFRL
ncbi:MAG TPA: CRISPR-associated endonuclease Cas2 [Desulfobacterales bacterium]|nr:CRISPR-associated endonuclease Cas2 [Desulfobacterales bacterium]HIP38852.1 CRISPR-associated endonuclease Cas2 [Desulfocapsa sulfexigens]